MQGSVYHLTLNDVDGGKGHPYVVVITFSGNRDCIVIPAYSVDGPAVNEFIASCLRNGMRDDQVYLRMNNAHYIDLPSDYPAKEAYWCIARPRRVAQKTVLSSRPIGKMKAAGMLMIVSRLLSALEDNSVGLLLSPKAIKSIRNYAKSLAIECGVPYPAAPTMDDEPPPDAANAI